LTFTSSSLLENTLAENRRIRLEKVLQSVTHDYNLRFEFGNRDIVGQSHIILKTNTKKASSASYSMLKGWTYHLLSHYLSDSQSIQEAARDEEKNDKPGFLALWHALEDARIENWFVRRWPGTHKSFEATLLPNLGGSLFRKMPFNAQLENGLYLEGRGYISAQYSHSVRLIIEQIRPVVRQAAAGESPWDTFQAMFAIYPSIAHLVNARRRTQQPEHSQQDSPKADKEAQRKEASELHREQPRGGAPEIETSGEIGTVGVEERRKEFPEWFRPGSMPWFERGIGVKEIHPSVIQTDLQTIVAPPKGSYEDYRVLFSEVQREAGFLTRRLTNMIREEVYLRFGGYYRSGQLNKAKLWKQRIGNYRLFQRPISGGSRAAAITLLVDESASMRGQDKYKIAKKAAMLLGETLAQLSVPLEIIGFTTGEYEARAALKLGLTPAYKYRTMRCSPLEHRIYKRFDEPYHVARSRLTGIEPRHNNWDEEHLLFAFQRIQARPERKKIIVVLSDGQPNGDANYLIQTVKRIESLGVEIIGIGIGAEFVKEIYPCAIVVADFPQMTSVLLHILAREFQSDAIQIG
jgi:hypothetical protein